jgi:hypothetical protein
MPEGFSKFKRGSQAIPVTPMYHSRTANDYHYVRFGATVRSKEKMGPYKNSPRLPSRTISIMPRTRLADPLGSGQCLCYWDIFFFSLLCLLVSSW